MNALQTLAQAAGVAYAAGLNLYATVGIIGLAARFGLIGPLPGSLAGLTSWWVIGVVLVLTTIEFFASLVPAVARFTRWYVHQPQPLWQLPRHGMVTRPLCSSRHCSVVASP